MPGLVLNMRGIGKMIDEGDYPVTLSKVSVSQNQNGDNRVLVQGIIRNSDTDFDGRTLTRSFLFSSDPEKDNSGVSYYLFEALIAFGADPDDFDTDKFDPEVYGTSLLGNKALARVTHRVDTRDAEKKYLDVKYMMSDD